MTGRHAKQTALTLKLTGGFLATTLLAGTFTAAAHANTLEEDAKTSAEVTQSALNLAGIGAVNEGGLAAVQVKLDGKKTGAAEEDARQADESDREADESEAAAAVSAEDFINQAKSQLGEAEDATGRTKFGEWYAETDRAGETIARDGGSRSAYKAAEWCNMFVSWVAEQTGTVKTVGQDAWTIAHAKWFKEQSRWGTTPKPGAIVFFNWNGAKGLDDIVHVGIVTGVGSDGTVHTVEGNTGNKVQLKQRSASQIVGYGYPEFKG
ncbi:CHAP domain-containing protein [Actinocorallia sp. API 0066]|uniref:CHAP domain-containing protein n=1 Tax=Actinocorallia sp. API 0066 TaxID=2896846 RepID=UPI001E637C47|nr:CHAP domain-containing protein [Actinocorallia sp. API 0066]MCD0450983.1 CHAP domain-containing protein [Actinocorallia sp. API 0066]